MAATQSGVVLQEGESLVVELEAELWATSANPIAQVIGNIIRAIAKILGTTRKGFLVITNKRVIITFVTKACWCITTDKVIRYILPSSVKEVGYTRKPTCGIFCPAYYLYFESFTESFPILLKKGNEEQAAKIATAFYNAIAFANK
jgi:hypothetical protein